MRVQVIDTCQHTATSWPARPLPAEKNAAVGKAGSLSRGSERNHPPGSRGPREGWGDLRLGNRRRRGGASSLPVRERRLYPGAGSRRRSTGPLASASGHRCRRLHSPTADRPNAAARRARTPSRSPGPYPPSSSPEPQLSERLPGHLPVVERDRAILEDLIGLVTLPGDHHHVASLRQREGLANRHRSIKNYNIPLTWTPHLFRSRLDLLNDPLRVLSARVVGGDHREIGQSERDLSHQRPLRSIPIATASEQDDQAARAAFPRHLKDAT